MKYQFIIQVEDSPHWPVKDARQAYKRLVKLGHEGRLGECVVKVQTVTEQPAADWKAALKPTKKK